MPTPGQVNLAALLSRLTAGSPTLSDCALLAESLAPTIPLFEDPTVNGNGGDNSEATDAWYACLYAFAAGAGGGPMSAGEVQLEQFATALVPVGGTTSLPAGAVVIRAALEVDTPYSPGTTISIGSVGSPTLLMGVADNDPTTADLYDALQRTPWPVAGFVEVAVGGAPLAGSGVVIIEYTNSPNP
jgi:hypothetical protein